MGIKLKILNESWCIYVVTHVYILSEYRFLWKVELFLNIAIFEEVVLFCRILPRKNLGQLNWWADMLPTIKLNLAFAKAAALLLS